MAATQGVACTAVDGKLYMLTSLSQPCFRDGHMQVFVSSIVVLLWCLVGFPASVFGMLRRTMPTKAHRQPEKVQVLGFMYAPLRDPYIVAYISIGFCVRLLVASTKLLKDIHPNALLALTTTAKLCQAAYVVGSAPFANKRVLRLVSGQALLGVAAAFINKALAGLPRWGQYCLAGLMLLQFNRILRVRFDLAYAASKANVSKSLEATKDHDDVYGKASRMATAFDNKAGPAIGWITFIIGLPWWVVDKAWDTFIDGPLFWGIEKLKAAMYAEWVRLTHLLPTRLQKLASVDPHARDVRKLGRITAELGSVLERRQHINLQNHDDIKAAIGVLDEDGDGRISVVELRIGFQKHFGVHLTPAQLSVIHRLCARAAIQRSTERRRNADPTERPE